MRALAAFWLCLLAAPLPAAAEWHFTPLLGVTFRGNTTFVDAEHATGDAHRSFGGAVTLLGGGLVGAEGLFVLTPRFFQKSGDLVQSSRVTALMGNVAVTTPRRWTEYSLRPFVSGGFGLLRVAKTEQTFPLEANFAAFNIGGGAVGFFSQRTGVRFDLRYYSTLHETDRGAAAVGPVHVRYMAASVGLVFRR